MEMDLTPYHVVYILTKLELGGAQKVCLALMDGMAQHHVPATLISGKEGILVDEVQKFDSVVLIESFKREVRISSIFNELRTLVHLIKLLRKLKKQHEHLIVHTHSTKAGIIGRWAAFFARIPLRIHTIHGYGFHDYQNRFIWSLIYLCEFFTSLITTHFICVAQHDRATGCKLFPRFARKSSIIRAAIGQEKFLTARPITSITDINTDTKKFVIGTISCFKPQKNLFDLLRAFEVTYYANKSTLIVPELQIIGDGIMRSDIESWIHAHKLEHAITLLGWQKDVIQWLETWNIFALSSLWEGLPCTIIEARICKLPIVAYDVGGIREVIAHEINGLLVPPGNWHELATHFTTLMHNKELYARLNGYNDQLDDFHTTKMVKQHLELYAQLSTKMQ